MTSCDLSDQTKNWKNTKKIAVSDYCRPLHGFVLVTIVFGVGPDTSLSLKLHGHLVSDNCSADQDISFNLKRLTHFNNSLNEVSL